jgi:ribosomal protein S18 acetylase RimI-like enzyme
VTVETSLRPPEPSERRDAVTLLSRELGDGAYTEADLVAPGVHVLATFAGNVMIGVGVAQEGIDPAVFLRAFKLALDPDTACIAALAVDPRERGRGVAKALLAALFERLRHCRRIIAVRREKEQDGLDRAGGFQVASTSTDYYARISNEYGWRCPVCGGACSCEAVLLTRP